MAYVNQQFYGAVNAENILYENFIIGTGNITANSNTITNFSPTSGYNASLLRVSQSIYTVSNGISSSAYITNISGSTITVSKTSSLSQSDTIGFSTPSGTYFFESASFVDPNNFLTVNDISGSDQLKDYAVLAAAKRNGVTVIGRFHAYKITEVVQRSVPESTISFFVEWAEPETEAISGDTIQTIETNIAIVDLTDLNSLIPEFSRETPGFESTPLGTEFAGWNIALNNYLSQVQSTLVLDNNFNDYVVTATGTNTLNAESNLRFDGTGLMIGGSGSAAALLQITGSGDLILIKNNSGSGVKVNNEGVLQLLSYDGVPTAIAGGIYYSGSLVFIGVE